MNFISLLLNHQNDQKIQKNRNFFRQNEQTKNITQLFHLLQFFYKMQGKGKKGGKTPTYIGLFACESKKTYDRIRSICRESLLQILKNLNPQAYLAQGEQPRQPLLQYEHKATEDEIHLVEQNLHNFQAFSSPHDNYHVTCLFIGHKFEKLPPKDQQIYNNWKNGSKQCIRIDFIVYVPNRIMVGYVRSVEAECKAKYPHITLLVGQGASAVESNDVLEQLALEHPNIFEERNKKVTALNMKYKNSEIVFVIDMPFEVQAQTGNNFINGKIQ